MQISQHSYAITGLGAVPPWMVNAGFIVGEAKTLIIDTGANTLAAQTIYGYATSVRPQNELLVFNCEPHFDHIGGNGYLRGLGIDVYGHPDIQRTAEHFVAEKNEYNQSITNPLRAAAREAEAFYLDTDAVNPNHHAVAGDTFDLGGIEVEILPTPGHTAINQSVYNKTENVFFCADCIVTDYIPNLEAGTIADWHSWLASLTMITELGPDIVVPGHGNVMRGVEIAVQIERMRGFVEQAIADERAPTISAPP